MFELPKVHHMLGASVHQADAHVNVKQALDLAFWSSDFTAAGQF